MAFDLYAVQKGILSALTTKFTQYRFFRNTVPEDVMVPRQGEESNPFFILQFGPMYNSPRGRSIKGARNDEYHSWVQVVGVGSVDEDIAASLALITDYLIGLKVAGATRLVPDGGPSDYGSRQYSVRPVLYYQSQRFAFFLTQNGLDGHLTA